MPGDQKTQFACSEAEHICTGGQLVWPVPVARAQICMRKHNFETNKSQKQTCFRPLRLACICPNIYIREIEKMMTRSDESCDLADVTCTCLYAFAHTKLQVLCIQQLNSLGRMPLNASALKTVRRVGTNSVLMMTLSLGTSQHKSL